MEGMDSCSWETSGEGDIGCTRGRLLAAFQDLETITIEKEAYWNGIRSRTKTKQFLAIEKFKYCIPSIRPTATIFFHCSFQCS